jgi:hypothetical protein
MSRRSADARDLLDPKAGNGVARDDGRREAEIDARAHLHTFEANVRLPQV